eukprot:scaffold3768_cov376-Prasinococcus_capsulatus_cf.AAC.29
MAEVTSSAVGNSLAAGSPGQSMKGVKGNEPIFSAAAVGVPADETAKFALPVDSEHKALKISICSIARPHMRAFHLSWMAFFTSFFSTFAAAPLLAVIREDLNLTKPELVNSGIAAVTGTIFSRVVTGSVCDLVGPRYAMSLLLLSSAPFVFGMALVNDATGFILCRFFIGFGLATFVGCQFWTSVMFSGKIVGIANATTAGWGNLGGGVTQLVMPLIFEFFHSVAKAEEFAAWRWSYFLPGAAHIILGTLVLVLAQDLPDGTYLKLQRAGKKEKDNGGIVFLTGCRNYRMWVLTITYGYCFGVELTVNNIIATYLGDQFDLNLKVAGVVGSCFGLMNLCCRSIGGFCSDFSAKKFGMRGRLWTLWIIQTVEGVMCIVMGLCKSSLAATVAVMIVFSVFVQAAEGASFGIVPFVSKRALGIVSGFVGAGGNAGSSITQALFFRPVSYETYEGLIYLGIMIIAVTALVMTIHFPQWGSMFFKGSPDKSEADYYLSEYTEEDSIKKPNLYNAATKFAENTKYERGPNSEPKTAEESKA